MIPPFVTWAGVFAAVCWLLGRIFGRIVDKLTDPYTDRWSEWVRKNTAFLPAICKRWILKVALHLLRPAIQISSIFLLFYIGVPIVLAKHLTLGQSIILAQATMPDPKAIQFTERSGADYFSIQDRSARTALMLSDHQRLIGLGLLEQGPMPSVSPHDLPDGAWGKGVDAYAIRYKTKLTHLGKLVAFWRFRVFK